ncbi:MAG: glycosyltransferase family 4 protein [Victivallaceae bacterium]|nr:glycosyltransferase family 4 protein [Victivallaceae bacterium]
MGGKKHLQKRILYVSEKAGFFGGVERYCYDTARVLKSAGWKVGMMFAEEVRDAARFLALFDQTFRSGDVDKIIAEEDFDLVVIFKVSRAPLVSKLRMAFNTAVCVSDHDYYCLRRHKYFPVGRINCPLPSNLLYCALCSPGRKRMFAFAALLNEIRRCRSFIVLSEFMRGNLLLNGFDRDSVFKIYPVRELPAAGIRKKGFSDPPVVMFAGQLIRGKGVDLMLRALARVSRPYHALIVGDGSDRELLEELARKLGIADKVEFTGWQDDVAPFWARADIAVFPSRWQEPFGLTGIEAFACQVPVIGFDVGGVSEWLHNGENGIAVPSKDITALYVELEYLLGEPETAAALGAAGYDFVAQNFTAEKFVAALDALIKRTRSADE